jgi:hypothetical protein
LNLLKLLTGGRSERRRELESLLASQFANLREEHVKKAIQKGDPNILVPMIRDSFAAVYRGLDDSTKAQIGAIIRDNWDILEELFGTPDRLVAQLAKTHPWIRKYEKSPESRRMLEATLRYVWSLLTVAAYNCVCAICGKRVDPLDFIRFTAPRLPPEKKYTHHACYAKLYAREKLGAEVRFEKGRAVIEKDGKIFSLDPSIVYG